MELSRLIHVETYMNSLVSTVTAIGLSIEIIRETIIDHSLFIYPYLHNMGIPGVEDILYCNMIYPPSLVSVFQYKYKII